MSRVALVLGVVSAVIVSVCGVKTCPETHTGPDCAIEKKYVLNETMCGGCNGVVDAGVCVNLIGGYSCVCNKNYIGKNCGIKEVATTCNRNEMTIQVTTKDSRAIQIHGHGNCALQSNGTVTKTESNRVVTYNIYEGTFSYTGRCNHFKKRKTAKNRMEYELTLDILIDKNAISSEDYAKTVMCDYETSVSTDVQPSTEENMLANVYILNEQQRRPNQGSIPEVGIGTLFYIGFFPTDVLLNAYPQAKILVRSLQMYQTDSRKLLFTLLDNSGCITVPGTDLLQSQHFTYPEKARPSDGRMVTAALVTFNEMQDPLKIGIEYTFDICKDGKCPGAECGNYVNNFRGLQFIVA